MSHFWNKSPREGPGTKPFFPWKRPSDSRVGAVDGAWLAHALLIWELPDGHEGEVRLHTTGAASHAEGRILVVGASHTLVSLLGGEEGFVGGRHRHPQGSRIRPLGPLCASLSHSAAQSTLLLGQPRTYCVCCPCSAPSSPPSKLDPQAWWGGGSVLPKV